MEKLKQEAERLGTGSLAEVVEPLTEDEDEDDEEEQDPQQGHNYIEPTLRR